MDQLHEELKEMTLPPPDLLLPNESAIANANSTASSIKHIPSASTDEDGSGRSSPSLSYSEAEYETCDSGVSEQSSLSDELPASSRGSAVSNAIPSIASNQSESPTSRSNYSRSPRYDSHRDTCVYNGPKPECETSLFSFIVQLQAKEH